MKIRLIREMEHQGVKSRAGTEWIVKPFIAYVSEDRKWGHIVTGHGTTMDVEIGKDAILQEDQWNSSNQTE